MADSPQKAGIPRGRHGAPMPAAGVPAAEPGHRHRSPSGSAGRGSATHRRRPPGAGSRRTRPGRRRRHPRDAPLTPPNSPARRFHAGVRLRARAFRGEGRGGPATGVPVASCAAGDVRAPVRSGAVVPALMPYLPLRVKPQRAGVVWTGVAPRVRYRWHDGRVMDIRSRNNVTVTGRVDGPVVVLSHGFGCDQNMWRLVVPALAERFRVVLFDHVGAGGSDLSAWSPERYATLDGYADDVLECCATWMLGPVMFVGHSVSAMIGVLAAAREPELFAQLVLLAPSPRYIDDGYLPGRVQRGGHRGAAGVAGQQLSGLVGGDGAGDHGQSGAAGAGRGADQQLLPHRSGDRPALRPRHVPVRQPRRPGRGDRADTGGAVLPGRDRAA